MEAAQIHESGPPNGLADILPFNPSQAEEGFFEPSRNPVVDRELREVDSTRRGDTHLEIFTLENGRHYEVVTGTPKRQRSDIGVVIGTALGTSIRGHNWHTLNSMMELGFPTTLVGPEGGHARIPKSPTGIKRFVQHLVSIGLRETSSNMHEILDETDMDGLREPQKIIKVGESRAAGIALGLNAQAGQFDREIVYTDAIAPCFPAANPIRPSIGLGIRASQLVTQVGSLGRNSPLTHVRRMTHYPKTVNLNPYFLMHVAATIPTLVSGTAGELARDISPDAKIHHTHFEDDPWSDPDHWEEIFNEDYPYVVHDRRPGDHGAIVREENQQARLVRLRGLRDELEAGHHDISRIDWRNVHTAGRLAEAA